MAQENIAAQESLGEALNKTELFFEKNGRKVSYLFLALLVLAGVVYGYRALVSAPRAEKAAEMIVEAQRRFESETPDFRLALEGDANGAGFVEIAGQYGGTPAGNLAKHYAGICYLRLGELENAERYLSDYSPVKGLPGALVNAQNYGLQGDVAVAREDYRKAVKFYEKAVAAAENNLTAPLYLRKAGQAAAAAGDEKSALAFFEKIVASYPASMEAREAQKLIGTVK